jgi:hypothetical protein
MSTRPRIKIGEQGSALALQPTLNEAFWRLYGVYWSRGVLDQRTKEIARIRNARMVNCGL